MYQQETTLSTSQNLLYRVFAWMGIGLTVTALSALAVVSVPAIFSFIFQTRFVFMGLIVAELALVVLFSMLIQKMSYIQALGVFLLYAALNGLTLSGILLMYPKASLFSAFLISAGMFAIMSVYGYYTKADLSTIGHIAFMGLIGFIIASLVNLYFKSSVVDYVLSIIGVFIFLALTAFDVSKLKAIATSMNVDREGWSKIALIGSLELYLDFINLFLLILRLTGRQRD